MARTKWAKRFMPGWWHQKQDRKARIARVRERDGDRCWCCGMPMRFGAPFNTRRSATVEHVLALSQGGTWALENLKLCHKGCNRHLGTNKPEQKQRMRFG